MKHRKQVKIPIRGYRKDDDSFAENMKNLYFDLDGSVDVRPGATVDNPALVTLSAANAAILIKKFNADKVWYNGADLYFNGTVLKNYASGAAAASAVEIFGNMYVAPSYGTNIVLAKITPTGTWAESSATYDGVNKIAPGIVCEHRGILFIARSKEGGVTYKNRIRWSNYGNPEDFDPDGDGSYSSYEDIGDDADEIVGLASVGNELLIFKRRSVWVASGIASDIVAPDYIRQLTAEYGLVGPNALTPYRGGVIFISDAGFVFTDGRSFKVVEDDMWRWSRTNYVPTDANWQFVRLVWSETFRTLFYYDYFTWGLCVKTNGEWNRWERMLKPFNYGDDVIFTAGVSRGQMKLKRVGSTQRHDQITSAVSTVETISPVYVTTWEDLGAPGTKKLPRSLYINNIQRSDTAGYGYTVKQYHDLDFATVVHSTTQILHGGAADLVGECEKIRLEIGCTQPGTAATTLDNQYFGFDDMTLGIKPTGGK